MKTKKQFLKTEPIFAHNWESKINIIEDFKIFNKRIIELYEHNCKEYRKYDGENYDADYYLFLGRASAYGDMMDIIEDMIIAVK